MYGMYMYMHCVGFIKRFLVYGGTCMYIRSLCLLAVRATTAICVVGLGIGFGSYLLYRFWRRYVAPVLPPAVLQRRLSDADIAQLSTKEADAEEDDEEENSAATTTVSLRAPQCSSLTVR